MKRRILIVDADPGRRERLRAELEAEYEVHAAADAGEALAACRERGPYCALVAGRSEHPGEDAEALGLCGELLPETPRLLVGGELDEGAAAVLEGGIFRLVPGPFDAERLLDAVRAAVSRFVRGEEERLLVEELSFSREALESLTRVLDRRLELEEERRRDLRALSESLNHADTLSQVAQLVAVAVSDLLDGRGTHVVFEDESSGDLRQAVAGGPVDGDSLLVSFPFHDAEVGHLRVQRLDRRRRDLTEADRELLASIAAQASLAFQLHVLRRERDAARRATLEALRRLAEHKDDETGRHLERVSEYSRLVATGLRAAGLHPGTIDDAWIEELAATAPLHDIGKVGVPDAILLKAGPLDDAEWAAMRRHVEVGAATIRRTAETVGRGEFLRLALEIVEGHHERWDGTGYPRGLVGEEIPLSARIVALADCYDALTSRRPYKQAWSHERALEEVRRESGLHFDPRAVEVFLKEAARVDDVRRRLADPPASGGAVSAEPRAAS